jgi:hypothetical protein
MFLSDDDGETWRYSKSFFPNTGEGSVAEIGTDGDLIFISRRTAATHCKYCTHNFVLGFAREDAVGVLCAALVVC